MFLNTGCPKSLRRFLFANTNKTNQARMLKYVLFKRNIWEKSIIQTFQQDGASSHTARETMALLRESFPHRLIARFGDNPWPPRSPDLSPPDLYQWDTLTI